MTGSHAIVLADCLDGLRDVPAVTVRGVAIDSRRVEPGDLFVALAGASADGHDHIDAAVAAGAVAVLAERRVDGVAVPVVVAADARRRAGRIAAQLAGDPSARLGCVGVTGTNGKTSVASFVAQLLTAVGEPAGYGGTLGWGFDGQLCRGALTTEDSVTVQARLASLLAAGARWVALEVSSHALEQDRVDAVRFDIAAFTNLTRDHLDYHGDMAAYAAAKRRLFDFPTLTAAVVNLDDPLGRALHEDLGSRLQLLGVGQAPDADLRIVDLDFDARGIRGQLRTPDGSRVVQLPLFGEFSFHNFVVALGVCRLAGASLDALLDAAPALESPPGRMQFVRRAGAPVVVIDYAHTPDALEKALGAVRAHCTGTLVCVFGCGGDRDPGKRPLMAAAVEHGADVAVVTNDNPRREAPDAIAAGITAGFSGGFEVMVELDREQAIRRAVERAGPAGMVLVAGKGHEAYQEIGERRIDYSDLEAVQRVVGD